MSMLKLFSLFPLVLAFAAAEVAADECEGDRKGMIAECHQYASFPAEPKIPPSDACCNVWKNANIPCLCTGVTKEKEKTWCMEKIVYIGKYCGKPMQPGYHCGSFTVPGGGQ
ncbi:hypothetical protein QOZ80_1AG0019360 [Eleusine coracana subsp. coracana]|uniref:Multifunctional seed storage albumin protein n=1 Tax=Eleusine coracana TaxID=4511 RepID=A0A2C9PGI4_ELECO|nr:multifunctional seed storage albumin protein [Eleusine coracana]KAK3164478.1 hypothetical protein QOZ80_1AG0019360 [Eleusine coracana subsp. coracana]